MPDDSLTAHVAPGRFICYNFSFGRNACNH
jgi:hypothetical protein